MRPRLLFLTNQLPYPPTSGGVIKSWRLLRHLCGSFDVTLFTLLKNGDAGHQRSVQDQIGLGGYLGAPIDRPRSAINFLKSLVFSPTLNCYRNDSPTLRAAMPDALQRHDLVLIDHLEMAQYVPSTTRINLVLHEHNAEFVMWRRSRAIARNPVERAVLAIESGRVRRFEAAACRAADLIFAAPNDQRELATLGVPPEKFRTTYHLGDDRGLQAPPLEFDRTERRLLYVGTLSWPANSDGLKWFLAEVFPVLKKKHPDLALDIAGKGMEADLARISGSIPGVRSLGFVDDLEPLFQRSRVFIAPLRFGSGTKVKVVTAMYRGLPCSTTSVGAEGLGLAHGEEIILGDDASAMIEGIDRLLTDRATWQRVSDSSRTKAARDLGWQGMLDAHVKDLLAMAPKKKK